jgi:hypothetical protein
MLSHPAEFQVEVEGLHPEECDRVNHCDGFAMPAASSALWLDQEAVVDNRHRSAGQHVGHAHASSSDSP